MQVGTIRKDRYSKPQFTERQDNNEKFQRGFMENLIFQSSGGASIKPAGLQT